MSTGSYDYTREDRVPFEETADDFTIGEVTAGNKSADDLERENLFTDVPPGDHILVVADFPNPPKKDYYKVVLNGQVVGFEAFSVMVKFTLPGNPRCSTNDFFLLPPDGDVALKAYYYGVPEGKKQAGWAASKFSHFINRLGFDWKPGTKLPDAARRLGNWKGRAIKATVEAGRGTYTDKKTGQEMPRRPQIKTFSYQLASSATMLDVDPGPPSSPRTSPHQGHSATPSQSAMKAGSLASAGLDDI